jgi:hypothetical protein
MQNTSAPLWARYASNPFFRTALRPLTFQLYSFINTTSHLVDLPRRTMHPAIRKPVLPDMRFVQKQHANSALSDSAPDVWGNLHEEVVCANRDAGVPHILSKRVGEAVLVGQHGFPGRELQRITTYRIPDDDITVQPDVPVIRGG